MSFKADLHIHSNYSDGAFTPEEIIRLACASGLNGISITDHDTIDAYRSFKSNFINGIKILTGVEFSSNFKGNSIHVLGYGFDYKNKVIADYCKRSLFERRVRLEKILNKLQLEGFSIGLEEFDPNKPCGRFHVAKLLVAKGLVKDVYYAFDKYLGEGRSCYYPAVSSDVIDVINVIHDSGGKAILAHPHVIKNDGIISNLLECDFDGIEAFYASFPLKVNKKWCREAQNRNMIITGGSDFHGTARNLNRIGASVVGKDVFDLLGGVCEV